MEIINIQFCYSSCIFYSIPGKDIPDPYGTFSYVFFSEGGDIK